MQLLAELVRKEFISIWLQVGSARSASASQARCSCTRLDGLHRWWL